MTIKEVKKVVASPTNILGTNPVYTILLSVLVLHHPMANAMYGQDADQHRVPAAGRRV